MKINEKNLCVFARLPPFDMEGFLYKRGEVNKAFQRRYFVLKGNLLFYFETRLDKEPLGLIIVEGCTIELSQESDMENYCFEIVFNGNRTYKLAADTQESMESWMKALTCAGYEYKRIIVTELQRQLQEIEDSRNKMRNDRNDAALADLDALGKPRPPPRRQNPFNRPAPPPPEGFPGVLLSPMPFIPSYFGSSNNKDNGNNSPQTTPKAQRRHALGSQNTIFYSDPPIAAPRSPVLAISNNNNNNNNQHVDRVNQQRRLAIEEFKRSHERFREVIMPDIIAYRHRRKQPLIQF